MRETTLIKDFLISINEKAVMRHLGYPATRAAESPQVERSLEMVRGFIRNYGKMMKPHAVYRFFPSLSGDGVLILPEEGIELGSPFLAGRFRDSEKVGLFVVTIGSELEEQVQRFLNDGKRYEAMVLDAIGSEAAEAAAWFIHRQIQQLCGRRLVRYSPGYNEGVTDRTWPISDQALIFRLLSPGQIGVSLSPSYMMKPRKSVSAIIGSASAS